MGMGKPATTTVHRKDPKVLEALRDAAGRPMTSEDRHKQRVSFIMGTMSRDSTITREEVKKIIKKRAV